jgi:hypothetical protein
MSRLVKANPDVTEIENKSHWKADTKGIVFDDGVA